MEPTEPRDAPTVPADAALDPEARYRLLAENATDVVLATDTDSVLTYISPSVTELLGWAPEELLGQELTPLLHPDDLDGVRSAREQLNRGDSQRTELRIRGADGRFRWVSALARPVLDENGRVVGRVGGWRDIQAEVETREALRDSEQRFRLLAENASDLVVQTDPEGVLLWVAPSVADTLGWDPQDMVGRPTSDFMHPDDLPALRRAQAETRDRGRADYEARVRTSAGGYRWIGITTRPVLADDGTYLGRVGSGHDIQAEVEARDALVRSERLFRLAMESAPTGMAVVDLDRRFVEVNPALCRMLGRGAGWLLTHRVPDVVDPDDDEADLQARTRVLSGQVRSETVQKHLVRADGSRLWVEHSVGVLRDDNDVPMSFVSQFVDVTEARDALEKLRRQATTDSLTHLANRRALFDRLHLILSHRARSGARAAVVFIDLDGLKPINDTHGHRVGDRVLIETAARIAAEARADDLVGRFGGDEFVMVLPGVTAIADAEAIAARIHNAVSRPLLVDGRKIDVTVSIGVAMADPGDDPDAVVHHADDALYRAKRTGGDRTVSYGDGTPTGAA